MQLTTVDLIDRYTVGWSDLLLFFDLPNANQIHFYGYPDGFEQVLRSSQLTVSGNCLQALYTLQTTTF